MNEKTNQHTCKPQIRVTVKTNTARIHWSGTTAGLTSELPASAGVPPPPQMLLCTRFSEHTVSSLLSSLNLKRSRDSCGTKPKAVIYEGEGPRLERVRTIGHPASPLPLWVCERGPWGCGHLKCLLQRGPKTAPRRQRDTPRTPAACARSAPRLARADRRDTRAGPWHRLDPAGPRRRPASRSKPRGRALQPALRRSRSQGPGDRRCWENAARFTVGTEASVSLGYAIPCVGKYAAFVQPSHPLSQARCKKAQAPVRRAAPKVVCFSASWRRTEQSRALLRRRPRP